MKKERKRKRKRRRRRRRRREKENEERERRRRKTREKKTKEKTKKTNKKKKTKKKKMKKEKGSIFSFLLFVPAHPPHTSHLDPILCEKLHPLLTRPRRGDLRCLLSVEEDGGRDVHPESAVVAAVQLDPAVVLLV